MLKNMLEKVINHTLTLRILIYVDCKWIASEAQGVREILA